MKRILVESVWLVGLVLLYGVLHGVESFLEIHNSLQTVLSW